MQALILVGGAGTRLQPLTLNTPKPFVPIGNRPFLLRQIELLKTVGITEIILSLNYQPSAIEKVLGDGSAFGVKLLYLIEPAPMGTAGGYKFAEKYLNATTIVLNGDVFTDIDLRAVVEHHKKCAAAATIVLVEVDNPAAYGLVEIDKDFKILRFLEKPAPDEIARLKLNTVNAGIYILEPEILRYIPEKENYSFEYQLFPQLLTKKEKFFAFVSGDDYWLDIGTHQRYLQAHYDLMNGRAGDFDNERRDNFGQFDSVRLDEKSRVADGVVIEAGASIKNSVLGENVFIGENTIVEDSVIWAGTRIEAGAKISGAIVGWNCRIGRNATLTKGSALGDGTIIADF